MTLCIDTREPSPHPWAPFWPDVKVEVATLACGDICMIGNADVVVERKTPADLAACIAGERERFERELRRATHLAAFAVVVSGTMDDLLSQRSRLHPSAVVGTLAAWSRRYRHSFTFCGSDALAADFAFRFLSQPPREAKRLLREVTA